MKKSCGFGSVVAVLSLVSIVSVNGAPVTIKSFESHKADFHRMIQSWPHHIQQSVKRVFEVEYSIKDAENQKKLNNQKNALYQQYVSQLNQLEYQHAVACSDQTKQLYKSACVKQVEEIAKKEAQKWTANNHQINAFVAQMTYEVIDQLENNQPLLTPAEIADFARTCVR